MGSKVVVTYKRKRFFSRSDQSPISLHSDKPSEISHSKGSAYFNNHEESIDEHTLQKKDPKFGACHDYSKDKAGETTLQCEKCDSEYCGQFTDKEAHKWQKFCSACTKQQNSSVSNQTQNSTLEQKACSQESNLTKISSYPNVTLEGNPEERSQFDSTGQSNAEEKSAATKSRLPSVNSGSEYEDKGKDTCSDEHKCNKTNSISPTPGASCGIELDLICLETSDGTNCSRLRKGTSVSGPSSLEESSKLNADQCSSLCNNNLVTKRKLTSTLITFSRRSKRNKENAANDNIAFKCTDQYACVTPLADCCSVDLKKEKKPPEDIGILCSFSAPEAAMVMHVDNPVHSPHGTAKSSPSAVGQVFENSHEQISLLQEKVCMDVHDNYPITVTPQDLSHEDANPKIPNNISVKRCFMLSSLDLSISPPASRDIDCNKPLDCDFGENHLPGCLEVHDSICLFSEAKTSQVPCAGNGSHMRAVSDKGKFIGESPPSPVENNCMQLFPENRVNETLQLDNDPKNTTRVLPSSLNTSRIHNLEQMVNGRAYYSSLYDWPHVQPKKPFQYFLPSTSNRADSLSRHLLMLDSILTRERSKSDFPTTWSEEELDCLWVGVRRHGLNNWDAIIRDPRLQFPPWRTEGDLADRWQDEQYRLFHGRPISQAKYTARPNFLPNHTAGVQSCLGVQQNPIQEYRARNRPPVIHYMDLARNCQFQKPVNYLPGCSWGLINLSEGTDFVKENLPHWLKETVEIPLKPSGPARNVVSSACIPNFDYTGNFQQPRVITNNAPAQRRTEPCVKSSLDIESGKSELHERQANNKNGDLIIINSDASSEETISDDQSIRP